MKAYFYFIVLLIGLLVAEYGFAGVEVARRKKPSTKKFFFKLNTSATFSKTKPLKAYAFLVGNDKYTPESKFSKLAQCYSDVKLLQAILIKCGKLKRENVFANRDLTLVEFKKRFTDFLAMVKAEDKEIEKSIIFTYSGHGNVDGSLVFVNGGMFKPKELKDLINSIKNDSIVILDACYSGNNEGPKEAYKKGKKRGYKSNSIRIYASLAHLTAKEISYDGLFFRQVQPFYKEVLGLYDLEGNGYFTAMIGLFFAEYKFKEDENISFKDLVSYVSNKGKLYVEYLATKQSYTKRFEATVRLNQQPKILPISQKVDFLDINHSFILIQHPIIPIGLEPGLSVGVFLPIGDFGSSFSSPALFLDLFLGYELDFLVKSLFLSVNTTFISVSSADITASSGSVQRTVDLTILAPSAGVYYRFFRKSFFNLVVGADAGIAITFNRASSAGPLSEESSTNYNTYYSGHVGFNFEVFKYFDIFSRNKFIFIDYTSQALYGFSFSLGATYHF